ncbi:hypothetical protein niasHS_006704 [Heterodera schachtii]|uniref:Uncharacterized protein n=1 Tax=Heterodera schachtii TaxID=97005 RepID=A0ABD2JI57_HETSC
MVRSFVNYSCRNNCCNNASETESPSNLLVIFTDPDDPESEEPMQYIFCEALRIASCNNNVHWIRAKPAMRTPNTPSDCVLRPNDLARIHLHYGFDALPSLIRLFCTKTLFVNAITCSALFLCMAANWMCTRQRSHQQHFPVVVMLRDWPQHYRIASMYSSHILRWRNDTDWTDLIASDGRKWAEDGQE